MKKRFIIVRIHTGWYLRTSRNDYCQNARDALAFQTKSSAQKAIKNDLEKGISYCIIRIYVQPS